MLTSYRRSFVNSTKLSHILLIKNVDNASYIKMIVMNSTKKTYFGKPGYCPGHLFV